MAKSAKKMLPYCAIKFTGIDECHATIVKQVLPKKLLQKLVPLT